MKTFLLQYLYKLGYAKVVFETDTNLFRFHVAMMGKRYVWHQPKNRVDFVASPVTQVLADTTLESEESLCSVNNAIAIINSLEQIVLFILTEQVDIKTW
jgi:hypothetical protein